MKGFSIGKAKKGEGTKKGPLHNPKFPELWRKGDERREEKGERGKEGKEKRLSQN